MVNFTGSYKQAEKEFKEEIAKMVDERKRLGIPARVMAEVSGFTVSAIQNFEKGKSPNGILLQIYKNALALNGFIAKKYLTPIRNR